MPLTANQIATASSMESVAAMMGPVATDEQLNEAVLAAGQDAEITAAAAAINFCAVWPTAKTVLDFIHDKLLAGNGWKAILRWALGKAIDAGKKYFETSCYVPE